MKYARYIDAQGYALQAAQDEGVSESAAVRIATEVLFKLLDDKVFQKAAITHILTQNYPDWDDQEVRASFDAFFDAVEEERASKAKIIDKLLGGL